MNGKIINNDEKMRKTPLDGRKKDRGDDFKKQDGVKHETNEVCNLNIPRKLALPDQGDVPVINKTKKEDNTKNKIIAVSKLKDSNRVLLSNQGDVSIINKMKKPDNIKPKVHELINLKVPHIRQLSSYQEDIPIINKISKTYKPAVNISKVDKEIKNKSKIQIENKSKLTADIAPKINTATEKDRMSLNKNPEINYADVKTRIGDRNVDDKVPLRFKPTYQHQDKDTNKVTLKSDLKTDGIKLQANLKAGLREIISSLSKAGSTKTDSDVISKEKGVTSHRKPIIKTVKSKYDNRVYKAVTFTEQKQHKPTVLRINIPNIQAKKTKIKLVDKNLEANPSSLQLANNKSTSKSNTKVNLQHNRRTSPAVPIKRKKLNRCISSPDKFQKIESPPTEVAKWAPSCLNAHTKPYYEAWVNTTLAAISKISKNDKLFFEKQNIIKAFQKSLELEKESSELVHEHFTDERYTGKIKIKHKNSSKRTRHPVIMPLLDDDKKAII